MQKMMPITMASRRPSSTLPKVRSPGPLRWMVYASLTGIGCFVAAILALHWLQPGLDPLDEALSYYVHGAHGWLLTVGLLGLGLASLALTVGLAGSIDGAEARAGRRCLVVWGVGVLLGGIFPTDPPGNWSEPPSVAGLIHGSAALVAFATLPLAASAFARGFRRDPRWCRVAGIMSTLAIFMVASLTAFLLSLLPVLISPGPPILLGLTERVLIFVYIVWLSLVGIGMLQMALADTEFEMTKTGQREMLLGSCPSETKERGLRHFSQ